MIVIENFLSKQGQCRLITDNNDPTASTTWIKLKLFLEERTRCLLNFLIKLLNYD
jgi:hypothetical protein